MSNRINLPELPSWATLADSERWHAGYLARRITDFAAAESLTWRPGCVSQIHFSKLPEDLTDTVELYALDSLLCALTHGEPKIALRALLQSAGYLAQLQERGRPTGPLRDAYVTAQHRVEETLRDPS